MPPSPNDVVFYCVFEINLLAATEPRPRWRNIPDDGGHGLPGLRSMQEIPKLPLQAKISPGTIKPLLTPLSIILLLVPARRKAVPLQKLLRRRETVQPCLGGPTRTQSERSQRMATS